MRLGLLLVLLGFTVAATTACDALLGTGDGGVKNSGNNGDGGSWKKPTFELTINGTHFGPAAPASNASAQLITTRNGTTGRVQSSTLTVGASLPDGSAGCAFTVMRQGDDISPIGVGNYQIGGGSSGTTPDNVVVPVGAPAVGVPQATWQCSGSRCEGSAVIIIESDSSHLLGYIAGRFSRTDGGNDADVVCSFWIPWSSYQP